MCVGHFSAENWQFPKISIGFSKWKSKSSLQRNWKLVMKRAKGFCFKKVVVVFFSFAKNERMTEESSKRIWVSVNININISRVYLTQTCKQTRASLPLTQIYPVNSTKFPMSILHRTRNDVHKHTQLQNFQLSTDYGPIIFAKKVVVPQSVRIEFARSFVRVCMRAVCRRKCSIFSGWKVSGVCVCILCMFHSFLLNSVVEQHKFKLQATAQILPQFCNLYPFSPWNKLSDRISIVISYRWNTVILLISMRKWRALTVQSPSFFGWCI